MSAGLLDMTSVELGRLGAQWRRNGKAAMDVAVRHDGEQVPLMVSATDYGLRISVDLDAVPDAAVARQLMRFHGHALAGAVTLAVSDGRLHAATHTPIPTHAASSSLITEALEQMVHRLLALREEHRSGDLGRVIAQGPLPNAETVADQTAEGDELAARVALALQERLRPVAETVPGRRMATMGRGRGVLGVEVVGVLVRVAAAVAPAPRDERLLHMLGGGRGGAVLALAGAAGADEHLIAVSSAKLPAALRRVDTLGAVLDGMCADVQALAPL